MMEGSGFWMLLAFNGFVLVIGVLLVWHWIGPGGSDASASTGEWYDTTQSLAREVATAADAVTTEDVERDFLPMASKLKRHAAEAPEAVDASIQKQTYHLAVRCQRFVFERSDWEDQNRGVFPEDRLQDIRERAVSLQAQTAAIETTAETRS